MTTTRSRKSLLLQQAKKNNDQMINEEGINVKKTVIKKKTAIKKNKPKKVKQALLSSSPTKKTTTKKKIINNKETNKVTNTKVTPVKVPSTPSKSKSKPASSKQVLNIVVEYDDESLYTIYKPGPYDVLLGRGRGSFQSIGNQRFTELTLPFQFEYQNATKFEKGEIARRALERIKSFNVSCSVGVDDRSHNASGATTTAVRFLKKKKEDANTKKKKRRKSRKTKTNEDEDLEEGREPLYRLATDREILNKIGHKLREKERIVDSSRSLSLLSLPAIVSDTDDKSTTTTSSSSNKESDDSSTSDDDGASDEHIHYGYVKEMDDVVLDFEVEPYTFCCSSSNHHHLNIINDCNDIVQDEHMEQAPVGGGVKEEAQREIFDDENNVDDPNDILVEAYVTPSSLSSSIQQRQGEGSALTTTQGMNLVVPLPTTIINDEIIGDDDYFVDLMVEPC